jgi:hypothetical protein
MTLLAFTTALLLGTFAGLSAAWLYWTLRFGGAA